MANPADVQTRGTGVPGSDVAQLYTTVNLLVTNLRILTAKLDLDAGVTDTDYKALVTDLGVGPAKLVNTFG